MTSNVFECNICSNEFSEEYCPRFLPCTHTLCSHCIDGIIATNKKLCPICRKEFTATSAEDLPINRIVLDVIIQQSSTRTEHDASSSKEPKTSIQGFNEDFREKCIKKGIEDCKETEDQVLDAIQTYKSMKCVILGVDLDIDVLMEKLRGIKVAHSEMLNNIDQSIELLDNTLALTLEGEEKLKNLDAELALSADFTSAGPIIDETESVFNEIQEKIRKTRDLLQKYERDTDSIGKEILNTSINLGNIAEEIKRRRIEDDLQVNMTPRVLQNFGCLLPRIDPREIFAVKVANGKQMVARVAIGSNNQGTLNPLKEGIPPQRNFTVKLDDLMRMPSRRGFLDLAANGTFLGRIIIKVIDEGNLALNFLHKCAGDMGSSYVNSKFLCLFVTSKAGITVGIGDYDTSQAVLPDVDWQEEKEREIYKQTSCKAGQVTGDFSDAHASLLYIVTCGTAPREMKGCFGVVEEGLDVLRYAILCYPDIKQVNVIGCGLMLFLKTSTTDDLI